jgi:hypothetical protein
MKVKATEAEVSDGTLGGCTSCGFIQDGCEPDARGYECENCGAHTVYGLEELLVMDKLHLIMEGEDDDR